jgi:hypothetical protein
MNKKLLPFLSFSILLFLLVMVTTVAEGGELRGRVRAAKGKTGPAVVWIRGLASDSVPERDTVVTHLSGGRFDPRVSIGFVGQEFVFRNDDDTMHNTHLYLHLARQKEVSTRPLVNGATLYNIALPITGAEVRRPVRRYHEFRDDTGHIAVKCNPHPEEEAFVLVFGHPFAAVSSADGRFAIADVPRGSHEVWVWHDGVASKWGSVEVGEGDPTEVVIEPE